MLHIITKDRHWEVSTSEFSIRKWLENHTEPAIVIADGYSGENHFEQVLNAQNWKLKRTCVYHELYLIAPDGEVIEPSRPVFESNTWIDGARRCLEVIESWRK